MCDKKLSDQTTLLTVFEEFSLEEVKKAPWKDVILRIRDKVLEHSNFYDMKFISWIGEEEKSLLEIESLLTEIAVADTFTVDYRFQVNDFGYLWLKDNKVEFRFEDSSGDNYYYHAQLLEKTKSLDEN